jgi:hypothetical protein
MLRMRLSLDCGCAAVATQVGSNNDFTVEWFQRGQEELLGALEAWCKARYGRQRAVAQAIGVTALMVNDWNRPFDKAKTWLNENGDVLDLDV